MFEGAIGRMTQPDDGRGSILRIAALQAVVPEPALLGQPRPWEIGLQRAASPHMVQVEYVHDILLVIIFAISFGVLALLLWIAWRYRAGRQPEPSRTTHNTPLEVAWTVIPALILVFVSVPSLRLLYAEHDTAQPDLTINVTGHQWYWSYEYPGNRNISFDAMLVEDKDLKPGQPRLLEAQPHMVVPVGEKIRLEITSTDVIHSWAVPSLGVKRDAVPGRLNEAWIEVDRPGLYYGQCSELCGERHAYMPIVVEAVPKPRFAQWVKDQAAAQG